MSSWLPNSKRGESIAHIAIYTATTAFTFYLLHGLLSRLMDNPSASAALKKEIARKLKRPELEKMSFTAHEGKLFADVVAPIDIDVCFDDIGGMDEKLEELRDNIILPLEMWYVYIYEPI
jgi:hypothetical protein